MCFIRPSSRHVETGPSVLTFSTLLWKGDYQTAEAGSLLTPALGAIWRVNADGNGLQRVIRCGARATAPAYSPDREWIYFQAPKNGRWSIHRCREDGSEARDLTRSLHADCDAFGCHLAPDGKRFVCTIHDGEKGRVAMVSADGAWSRRISPAGQYCYMAAFWPDGERILYSNASHDYRLMMTLVNSSRTRVLTPNLDHCYCAQPLHGGKTVLCVRRDGDLYGINLKTRAVSRFTENSDHVELHLAPGDLHGSTDPPHALPDGHVAWIAKTQTHHETQYEIWLACITRGNHFRDCRCLWQSKAPCGRVRLSPDGRFVAFISRLRRTWQLCVLDINTGVFKRLTNVCGAVNYFSWRP